MVIENVIAPLILIGVLIFIHEAGHFLAGKILRFRILKFSLGFGPKLIGFTRGETEYVLALFPLGGFVKFHGQDLTGEDQNDDDKDLWLSQPVWKRSIVVLAGPLMNLAFAVVVLYFNFIIGVETPASVIGSIVPGTVEAAADLHPGDRILAIDDQPVNKWNEVAAAFRENPETNLQLVIARGNEKSIVQIKPDAEKGISIYGEKTMVGRLRMSNALQAPVIGVIGADSPAAKAGLQTGDWIYEVNGAKIDKLEDLPKSFRVGNRFRILYDRLADDDNGERIKKKGTALLIFENPEEELHLTENEKDTEWDKAKIAAVIPSDAELPEWSAKELGPKGGDGARKMLLAGIAPSERFVYQVFEESAAEEAGIKKFDLLVEVDGKQLLSWWDFKDAVENSDGKELDIALVRDGELINKKLTPKLVEYKDEFGMMAKGWLAGIRFHNYKTAGENYLETFGPVEAFPAAVGKAFDTCRIMLVSMGKMVTGKVGAEGLGGPIMIWDLTRKSAQIGVGAFIQMMVLISLALFVFNLLPIPVLDGGHIFFFYVIEIVRGKPLSARGFEIATWVGLSMVLMVFSVAFYNDILRLLGL